MSTKTKVICVAVGIILIIGGVLGLELIGDIGVIPSGVWTLPCFLGLVLIAAVIGEGIQSIMDESIEREAMYYKKIDEIYELLKNKDEKGGEG